MTYNRTSGKGGYRNSPAARHPKLPDFNKNTVSGFSRPARKGKTVLNPGAGCAYKK
jgi:hypothetical protein